MDPRASLIRHRAASLWLRPAAPAPPVSTGQLHRARLHMPKMGWYRRDWLRFYSKANGVAAWRPSGYSGVMPASIMVGQLAPAGAEK